VRLEIPEKNRPAQKKGILKGILKRDVLSNHKIKK
jgi:hypothetical protein